MATHRRALVFTNWQHERLLEVTHGAVQAAHWEVAGYTNEIDAFDSLMTPKYAANALVMVLAPHTVPVPRSLEQDFTGKELLDIASKMEIPKAVLTQQERNLQRLSQIHIADLVLTTTSFDSIHEQLSGWLGRLGA